MGTVGRRSISDRVFYTFLHYSNMNKLFVCTLVCLAFPLVLNASGFQENKNELPTDSTSKTQDCSVSSKDYSCDLKQAVDDQINMELDAFYAYLKMGNFFAHESYYLPGLSKFLLENSQEELKHAQKMIEYQSKRGARVEYKPIEGTKLVKTSTWNDATEALKAVLELELAVTKKIEKLHRSAGTNGDIHLQDFLESNFIPEQYDSMKNIADKLKTLQRITRSEPNAALAEFQFDKLVMQEQK